jgi:hypothetical protein
VFQLSAPGLAARFPPRRTAGQVVGNSAVLAALQADPAGRELMARSASPSAVTGGVSGAAMARTEIVAHVLGLLEAELDRSPATPSAADAHRTGVS